MMAINSAYIITIMCIWVREFRLCMFFPTSIWNVETTAATATAAAGAVSVEMVGVGKEIRKKKNGSKTVVEEKEWKRI